MTTIKEIESRLENEMKKSIDKLKEELSGVRTGRANPRMLDSIKVDVYGSQVSIQQLGSVGVPEPRLIEIRPWDINSISDIEKSISKSKLDLNPTNDGKIIRILVPPLTEETRKDLVKYVKHIEEQHKISLRNARRDAIDEFKSAEKEKKITEDAKFKAEEEAQKITDKYIHIIDEMIKNKEVEIMEV